MVKVDYHRTKASTLIAMSAIFAVACSPPAKDTSIASEKITVSTSEVHNEIASTTISETAAADFPGLEPLCGEPSRPLTKARVSQRKWEMPRIIPAAKVFDNLYFVGNGFSSAWIVKTDEGLVLIDTLFNGAEAKLSIDEGLKSVGLDPADIKYVVVSHGHGDHYGGAQYIVDNFGSTLIMSAVDWAPLENPEERWQAPGWNEIPTPDILVEDEYDIVLGNTTIQLKLAPGHTLGTLSTYITVEDEGVRHKALLWGGTGYNFGPKLEQYAAYAASADEARRAVLDDGIEVFLSNHVRRDQSDKKIETLADRQEGELHPFVMTPERIAGAFEIFGNCARLQVSKLENGDTP